MDVTSIVAIIVRININWFSVVHSMHLHAFIHLLFPLFTFIAKMGYNGFSRPQESLLPIQKTKLKIFSNWKTTRKYELTKMVKTMATQNPPMICNMANINQSNIKHGFFRCTPTAKVISVMTIKKYPPPMEDHPNRFESDWW